MQVNDVYLSVYCRLCKSYYICKIIEKKCFARTISITGKYLRNTGRTGYLCYLGTNGLLFQIIPCESKFRSRFIWGS